MSAEVYVCLNVRKKPSLLPRLEMATWRTPALCWIWAPRSCSGCYGRCGAAGSSKKPRRPHPRDRRPAVRAAERLVARFSRSGAAAPCSLSSFAPCCTAAPLLGDDAAGAAALRARGAGGTELAHAGPVPGALRLQEAGADGEDHGRRPAGRRRLAERRVHRRHGGHHAARGPAAQRDPERSAGAGQGALGRRLLLRRRRAARELRHGRERRAQ